jgi:3-hydroxyacyl-[acyl-carrier-protein] dehydratase
MEALYRLMVANIFHSMSPTEKILSKLPYSKPFRFVDQIHAVEETGITGSYHLHKEHDFYKGHFTDYPITPGVILTEIMTQIGLVCLGIFLTEGQAAEKPFPFVLCETNIAFHKPVYPDETVTVTSEKIYFRFGKLKCKVSMKDKSGEIVCDGTIAGIQIKEQYAAS